MEAFECRLVSADKGDDDENVTAQYFRIFRWHVLRHLRRHLLLALLNILSVALGVAVYLATQIANHSANRAFAATVDLVAGKAEVEITAPAGHLPETVFPSVAAASGVSAATPVVRGLITLPDFPGEYLQIIGIDVFTNEPFRTFDPTAFDAGALDIQGWLGPPGSIALSEEFLTRHHLKAGDTIRARVNVADHDLRVGFVLRGKGAPILDSHFAAMDIGWAQELFGRRGELSAIQLRLINPGEREKILTQLRQVLPKDANVMAPAQRTEEVDKMLGGFELNLSAMSLVSLVVGMFLIYNTVSASVARRQREIGILRSLGVTRNEVRALFLAEAVSLGFIGVLLGLVGGTLLAQFLSGAVAETISSLYVLVHVKQVALEPWSFALAGIIGLGSVLVSAWLPAQAAAKMEPVRALHGGDSWKHSFNPPPVWLWSGLLSLGLAAILSFLALWTGPPWLGFGAAFFVLASFSLLVPPLTFRFSASVGKFFRSLRRHRGKAALEAELGAANLSRALLRNSVTIAALAAAVAMTVGVSVMVFSFRRTVERWINDTLIADIFITPASNEIVGPFSFTPPEVVHFLETHPAVETIDTFRDAELPMGSETISVAVIRGSERRQFQFLRGSGTAIMRRFHDEPCVLISEAFARRHHVGDDGSLELTTPEGARKFPVAGIFYDYSRDQGVVFMSQQNFIRFWHDDRVNSVAVYLKKDGSAGALTDEFQAQFSRSRQFVIFSNRSLRTRIFEIFDQTFAVTYVLLTIAIIVAITGIFLSLTILITERSRELAILRAIGGSAGQIRKLLLWETAMIGVLASLVGIASGACLSLVLTGVINRAFFGWTIRLAFPWRSLAFTPIWILAVAVIAGIIPAWRASRMELADNLRSE
ncbi:MAG TPA: FtsX-like permease family protein [Chthoniobacterales bacterium]|nr:FtsX-like permease family protein [Chthoniobacterales bacterium]